MATDELGIRFIIASDSGDLVEVKRILDTYGNDIIESIDGYGCTSLMRACWSKYTEIVKLLLEKGANVNAVNKEGWSALMHCCCHGQNDIAELLLEKGAYVEQTNINGNTILHSAAMCCSANLVRLLMKVRPSLASVVNKQGYTAYEITLNENIKEIILGPIKELLKEGNYEEVLKRYKINVIQKDSVKEDTRTCPICFDTASYTTECNHDYCLECYLNFYKTKKCPNCRTPLTQTLFAPLCCAVRFASRRAPCTATTSLCGACL